MKLFFTLIIACGLSGVTLAQYNVSGLVTGLNNQPVANHQVIIGPNTKSGPGYFAEIVTTTNANGIYSGTLPNTIPVNTDVYIRTLDCNNNTTGNLETYTGSNITSNLVICGTAPGTGGVGGKVFTGSNKRNVLAVVYRIEKCGSNPATLTLIDSAVTDTTGQYYFNNFPAPATGCDLLMKAALLPADAHYSSYLPGYFVNMSTTALLWSNAAIITKQTASTGVDFALQAGNNPGGPGFIGGSVTQGANKGTAVGDPVVGRMFLLTDVIDNPVAYAFSDINGKFSFDNLAYGTYKVFGDAWGKDNPHLVVTIDNTTPSVNTIIFSENSTELKGQYTTSANDVALNNVIAIYPNPVNDIINISGLGSIRGSKQITITSTLGTVVYTAEVNDNPGIIVHLDDMPKGIYLLRIATGSGDIVRKMVK